MRKALTYFGKEMQRLRVRYGFHNKSLIGENITRTDIEKLSRMSHDKEYTASFTDRIRLVKFLSQRIIETVDSTVSADRLNRGLLDAINRDMLAIEEEKVALDIVKKLVLISGRSVEQIYQDVMSSEPLDKLLQKWNLY